MAIGSFRDKIHSEFHIWPWKFKVEVMFKVMSKVNRDGYIRVQPMFHFVSWRSDHWCQRSRKFYTWIWKFKVKVMAKVKPNGHIWGLDFNRDIFAFRFVVIGPYVGWDIACSIIHIENSRSRSQKSTKFNQVTVINSAKIEWNPKVIAWKKCVAAAGAVAA